MRGWKIVLKEMTKDFHIIYVETREKISSQVNGKTEFSVEAIAKDIVKLVEIYKLEKDKYIIFGSSLGGTSILESYKELKSTTFVFCIIRTQCRISNSMVGKNVNQYSLAGTL